MLIATQPAEKITSFALTRCSIVANDAISLILICYKPHLHWLARLLIGLLQALSEHYSDVDTNTKLLATIMAVICF